MDWLYPTTDKRISETDINRLFSGYQLSPYLKEKFRPFIRKNWATRNNGNGKQLSVDELVALLQSKCSKSQMKNIENTAEQIRAMEENGATPVQIEPILNSKSKYFTDGVYGVLGEDVIWNDGEVKDFKEKEDRYVECAEELATKAMAKAMGAKRKTKRRKSKRRRSKK
jgi:hypothetical protein